MFIWIVSGVLILLRGAALARGHVPEWLQGQSSVAIAGEVVRAAAMLVSWIGSIYVWAKVPRKGFLHGLALVLLVFLGMVIGPFYILASKRFLGSPVEIGPRSPI